MSKFLFLEKKYYIYINKTKYAPWVDWMNKNKWNKKKKMASGNRNQTRKTLLVRSYDEIQNIKTTKWQFVYVPIDKYIHFAVYLFLFHSFLFLCVSSNIDIFQLLHTTEFYRQRKKKKTLASYRDTSFVVCIFGLSSSSSLSVFWCWFTCCFCWLWFSTPCVFLQWPVNLLLLSSHL